MTSVLFSDLRELSVVVTGGASGVGAAIVQGFLAQGARVTSLDLVEANAVTMRLSDELTTGLLMQKCDVSEIPLLKQGLARAAEAQGPIDVLVNNAANDKRHATEDVTEEFWQEMQSINFKSYFFACQAVAPEMSRRNKGAIINMTSISYMMGNSGYPIYAACNSGLSGLTRSLAREFGLHRVRVNAVAPGWVLTEKQKRVWATPSALEEQLKRQCLKRHLEPEDIVGAVLFLASESSAMLTGQTLVVDGGVVVTG